MKRIFLLILTLASVSYAQTKKESLSKEEAQLIEERIQELEEKQKSIQEWYSNYYLLGRGRMSPFLGERINFGGFYESVVGHIEGPDTKAQTAAYSHQLGINISAQLAEPLKLVAQYIVNLSIPLVNPHNNPLLVPVERSFSNLSYGAILREGYVELKYSEAFSVQTGLGPIPFGYALQVHDPFYFYTKGGPQITGHNDTANISSFYWMGVQLVGKLTENKNSFGYSVYTFSPPILPNSLGVGGRLWWSLDEALAVGVSAQTGEQQDQSFFTHGIDISFKQQYYGATAEYAILQNTKGVEDIETYYLEPYVKVDEGRWIYYLRGDYLSYPGKRSGAVSDPIKKWQYSGGVNWLPIKNVRFRLGYAQHDYLDETDLIAGRQRDYHQYEFSVVTLF